MIKDKTLDQIFDIISKYELAWNSNPLHLYKNGRSRILNNKVVINPYVNCAPINSKGINNEIKLGSVLEDKSTIGKMRDIYPVTLFTFKIIFS